MMHIDLILKQITDIISVPEIHVYIIIESVWFSKLHVSSISNEIDSQYKF